MTFIDNAPARKHLPHPAPLRSVNHPTILFVTMCVKERRSLLNTSEAHGLLMNAWHQADRWHVGRYVIMPDHIHFFCAPGDETTPFKEWVLFWRNTTTHAWPVVGQKPLWQRDYWDRQLRREEGYHEKWEYVRHNPVRAGLAMKPEDWPYQGELNVLRW